MFEMAVFTANIVSLTNIDDFYFYDIFILKL